MIFFHFSVPRACKNAPINLKMCGIDQKWSHWPLETMSRRHETLNGLKGWLSPGALFFFGGEGIPKSSRRRSNSHIASKRSKCHFSDQLHSKMCLTCLNLPRNTSGPICDTSLNAFLRPKKSKITDRYRDYRPLPWQTPYPVLPCGTQKLNLCGK